LTLAVYDLYLQFAAQVSLATLSMVWAGLMVGAQADLFSQRFRKLTLAICGISGLVAIFFATPGGTWREKTGAAVTVGAIVWLFGKMQDYWTNDLTRRLRVEKYESVARSRLHAAEKNAQIGMQARTIAHELGNLIQNLELSATNPGDIDRVQLTRSLYFIKRINKIVLRDIDQQLQSHFISVQDLVDDINLLLRPDARALPCQFDLQADSVVRECQIEERPGALFLIIQNLVRNGIDAIAAANLGTNNGFISLKFSMGDNEVCIEVSDNGTGMSEKEMRSLFRGERESSRAGKHGLGFLFVQEEARRNRVSITATSKPDFGTTFYLRIPVKIRSEIPDVT
jgi:signal transduction histidine kinase